MEPEGSIPSSQEPSTGPYPELYELLSTSYNILLNILLSRLSPYIDKILGIISVGFDIADQLLIGSFAFVKYWRRNGSTMRHYISCSWTFKKSMIQLGGKYCTIF
jgi:hypothetical protein